MTFRISVELSHQCPVDEIAVHAELLDSHNFYRVWVPDTLVSPWEAWMAASTILHHTEQIRIGVGVTNPYTRHPVVVAQMAATFQHLSNGRFSVALGKGIKRFLEKIGIDQKADSVEACAKLIKQLASGERVTFKGAAFQIDGIHLRTAPLEQGVPIFLAATNAETWQTAMAVADGVTTFWSPQAVELNRQAKGKTAIHTSAMVPFSLSQEPFFNNTIITLDDLEKQLNDVKQAGFDEAVIAYRDLTDLKALQGLV